MSKKSAVVTRGRTIPFEGLDSGVYEVTVTASVGAATAKRTAVVEVR